MKKIILLNLVLLVILIAGCTQNINSVTSSCQPNWVYEGTYLGQKNYSSDCTTICSQVYNTTSFRIDINGTTNSPYNYCYCDANRCGQNIINSSPLEKSPEVVDYGSDFSIVSIQNISSTNIQVYIRNIGHGNITLAKLTVYVNGETETVTNIVGTQSNTVLGVGEIAKFDVSNLNSPCGKTLKIALPSGQQDTRIINC